MPAQAKKNKTGSEQLIFGLIGDPVFHSFSPLLWNTAFNSAGVNAHYQAFRVTSTQLKAAFLGLQALNVRGINVTRPHKHEIAKICDCLVHPADVLQAVNTVKFSPDRIVGWNTDALALKIIFSKIEARNKALILGSGATAMAAIWALAEVGCEKIFQISRREIIKPDFLSARTEWSWLSWTSENLGRSIAEAEILLNATPLGWKKEDCINEFETKLNKEQTFIDVNYSDCSQLLAAAQKAGCTVVDGRELLVLQAVESFGLLTELEADEKIMRSCIF